MSPTSSDDTSSRSGLRKAVLAIGLIAVVYLARRRAKSSDIAPSTDQLREKAGEALPDEAARIPIGATGGDESRKERTSRPGDEGDLTGTGTGQSPRDEPAATDRTLEEVEEREGTGTGSPAGPGASGEGTVEEDPTGGMGDYGSDDGDDGDDEVDETDHGIQ